MLEPTGPSLAGIGGAMMSQTEDGGLTVEGLYPDESPPEEPELAKIPATDEAETKEPPQRQAAER